MSARNDWFRWGTSLAAVMMIVYILGYVPTPYVVYKPGLAEDVGPMVHVEAAEVAEHSVFMLTTVRQMYPNWLLLGYARFNPNWDVYKKTDIYREGETREEYSQRQQYVMLSSQSNAMQAAYKAAGIPFELSYEGVMVLRTIAGMPAADKLQSGDYIETVNGASVTRSDEIIEQVRGASIGDLFELGIVRGGQQLETQAEIGDFSKLAEAGATSGEPQPGLGIQLADMIAVKAEDAAQQVEIRVDDIGGPSAGLIFALEIYDQLTPGDLSKGYRIAGTGEVDTGGTVGIIGGVKHKVAAAELAGADLFFVPPGNADDALAKAKAIGTAMRIVPADSLQAAIDYLAKLPSKNEE